MDILNKIKRDGVLVVEKFGEDKRGKAFFRLENNQVLSVSEFLDSNDFEIQCNGTLLWEKRKGFQYSWLTKLYYSSKWNNRSENNPFRGQKHSQDYKDKRSKERKGVWGLGKANAMHGRSVYDFWFEKYGKEIADQMWFERSLKNSEASFGENNKVYGRKIYDIWVEKYGEDEAKLRQEALVSMRKEIAARPEVREKKSLQMKRTNDRLKKENPELYYRNKKKANRASLQNQGRYKMNRIEALVEGWLKSQNIDYEYSKILGFYQFDFGIKNKRALIEVQGDYWHANPVMYGDIQVKNLTKHQQCNIVKDLAKLAFALKNGFKVYYIWEKDIHEGNFNSLGGLLA